MKWTKEENQKDGKEIYKNGHKTTIKGKKKTGTKTQPKRNYKVTQH